MRELLSKFDKDSALIAVEDQSLPNTRENRARSVLQSVTVQHGCNQRHWNVTSANCFGHRETSNGEQYHSRAR